jgi:hypothetical protein
MKFVVTRWTDEFDMDGMTSSFSILGELAELSKARACLKRSAL